MKIPISKKYHSFEIKKAKNNSLIILFTLGHVNQSLFHENK